MKKTLAMILTMGMMAVSLAACGSSSSSATTAAAETTTAAATTAAEAANTEAAAEAESEEAAAKMEGAITVVSREDGSGTRGAFIELFGIEQKNDAGEKVDMTTEDAEITNSTAVMMTTVSGNKEAIGYVSLGSLNDTVKAVKIDGVVASADNVKSGDYKISRPFNIVTLDTGISDVAQDFINFILSDEGQAVVEGNGYISEGSTGAFETNGAAGKVVVAGSSSVTPVMEKLKEAYAAVNADANIEVQQSDSTTGVTSAIQGVCDIGMASRELKDSETEQGVSSTVIAIDGIAMIVNHDNTIDELSSEDVLNIYTGEITDWADIEQ
ncbi:MAG: substrate-binding domain-containing protein [Clostridiales bacterium]|nr:substrate-binding domain-containing protein [Clostridiales bacterium]